MNPTRNSLPLPSRRSVLGLGAALALQACGGGGDDASSDATGAGGRFVSQPSMSEGRREPGIARLPDGRVLVAGGTAPSGNGSLTSAEIFDPRSVSWTSAPGLSRGGGFMIALADGRALSVQSATVAEVYDPATGRWSPTAAGPSTIGSTGSLTRLADGRVLVLGLLHSMIYSPRTNTWAPVAGFDGRRDHAAVQLADGKVWVSGGWLTAFNQPLSSTLLFDPEAGTWQAGPRLRRARVQHFATRLPDGKVLVSHGVVDSSQVQDASEIFDPQTASSVPTAGPVIKFEAGTIGATATDLGGGRLLVIGGGTTTGKTILDQSSLDESNAEIFEPASRSWVRATRPGAGLITARRYHSAVALADGGVLVVGGLGLAGAGTAAEIWRPA